MKERIALCNVAQAFIIRTDDHEKAFLELQHIIAQNYGIDIRSPNADCILIRPEGKSIGVDQIRKSISFLTHTPAREHKIMVILYAEQMTKESYNAALKLLEEPLQKTKIFLISSKTLPATVRSRCHQISHFFNNSVLDKEYKEFLVKLTEANVAARDKEHAKIILNYSQQLLWRFIKEMYGELYDKCEEEDKLFSQVAPRSAQEHIDCFERVRANYSNLLKYDLDHNSLLLLSLEHLYEHFGLRN